MCREGGRCTRLLLPVGVAPGTVRSRNGRCGEAVWAVATPHSRKDRTKGSSVQQALLAFMLAEVVCAQGGTAGLVGIGAGVAAAIAEVQPSVP